MAIFNGISDPLGMCKNIISAYQPIRNVIPCSPEMHYLGLTLMHLRCHLYFFPTLNKEQNSSYLQLRRRLNGKLLVLEFVYSKSAAIVQRKLREKKQQVKRLRFSLYTNQHMYPKNCPLKIACSRS